MLASDLKKLFLIPPGGVLLLAAVFTACILPNQREVVNPQTEKPSVMRALKVPSILMAAYK